jgi:sortase A
MAEGDIFYIHVLDQTLAYEVDQIEVILPEELSLIQPVEGEDLVTLLTCTPYAVNTHRLLVRGSRVPYEETEAADSEQVVNGDSGWRAEYLVAVAAGVGVLILLIIVIRIVKRIRNKGQKK